MQTPTITTPVRRCLAAAAFSARMLGKFSDSPQLTRLSQLMSTSAQMLAKADEEYTRAAEAMVQLRVDTTFENHASDQRIRRTFKLAELADGRKNGRIVSQVFPHGLTAVVKLTGDSQIAEMQAIETRLGAVTDLWPEAHAERDAIAAHRIRYQAALAARAAKEHELRTLRTARDAARERYAEVASLVKAEYPRDRVAQELFFTSLYRSPSGKDTDLDDTIDLDGDAGDDEEPISAS